MQKILVVEDEKLQNLAKYVRRRKLWSNNLPR